MKYIVKWEEKQNKILNIKNSDIAHLLGKRGVRSREVSQEPIGVKVILKKPSYIYSNIYQTQIYNKQILLVFKSFNLYIYTS